MAAVIEVERLHKRYREVTAVDGVSFQVAEREVFGIVGPNGAGKTTDLLDRWGLGERRAAAVGTLSGGRRQRLLIALALVGRPEVVFLDELTTGLDPQAPRDTWELVRAVRDAGATVVLVTHLMEEAERLCDRVAVIDRGRLVALDPAGPGRQGRHGQPRRRVPAPHRPGGPGGSSLAPRWTGAHA